MWDPFTECNQSVRNLLLLIDFAVLRKIIGDFQRLEGTANIYLPFGTLSLSPEIASAREFMLVHTIFYPCCHIKGNSQAPNPRERGEPWPGMFIMCVHEIWISSRGTNVSRRRSGVGGEFHTPSSHKLLWLNLNRTIMREICFLTVLQHSPRALLPKHASFNREQCYWGRPVVCFAEKQKKSRKKENCKTILHKTETNLISFTDNGEQNKNLRTLSNSAQRHGAKHKERFLFLDFSKRCS